MFKEYVEPDKTSEQETLLRAAHSPKSSAALQKTTIPKTKPGSKHSSKNSGQRSSDLFELKFVEKYLEPITAPKYSS